MDRFMMFIKNKSRLGHSSKTAFYQVLQDSEKR